LRLSASVLLKRGEVVSFVRRKGTKNTLLGGDGKSVLGEDALRPFLGAITAELFATHFAMGYDDLIRGGDEILKGQGDVGRSLFSAAVGGGRLRDLLDALEREAAELFAAHAQKPEINHAFHELEEKRREVRDKALSVDSWRRQQEGLEAAIGERREVGDRLAASRVEIKRLSRLRDLLPKLDEWRAQRQRREALGEVVSLPPEFGEQRRKTMDACDRAKDDQTKAEHEIAQRDSELAELIVDDALIEAGTQIDKLHLRLGNHQQAAGVRPSLQQRKIAAENEARRLLTDLDAKLDLAKVEQLRPSLVLRTRIETLSAEGVECRTNLKTTRERLAEIEAKRLRIELEYSALPPARDPLAIAAAVEAALSEGKGTVDLQKLRSEARAIETAAGREIDRLGLWHGSLEVLERVPFPGEETIASIESAFAEVDRARAANESEQRRLLLEGAESERQIAELVHAGDVPSEDDLAKNRDRREQLWNLVRRAWLADEDVTGNVHLIAPDKPLPEAYEASVVGADTVADRLRREAGRVAVRASAQARLDQVRRQRENILAEEKSLATRLASLKSEWQSAWATTGVEPRSPKEMRVFLLDVMRLRERAEKLREVQHQIVEREQRIESLRTALQAALRAVGESDLPDDFSPLLSRARQIASAISDTERKRTELEKALADSGENTVQAQRTVETATSTLSQWEKKLEKATSALPVSPGATPVEAVAVLVRLDEIVRKVDDARREETRLDDIDKNARQFSKDAADIATKIAPDLAGRGVEDVVESLNTRRGEARERAVSRDETKRRREEAVAVRADAARRLVAAVEKLATLCEQARCSTPEGLSEVEDRSKAAKKIDERITEIEGDLASLGATIDQAVAEVASADESQMVARIDVLGQGVGEDEERERVLSEQIGEARRALQQMDEGADAIQAAEEEQAIVARIRDKAERYVTVRLAARLLQREIEVFRAAHQDPLLGRASAIFARLTLGSFERLEADFNERDEPVMIGVRPAGGHIRVEGMSAGTRDQLHLALRLAHLEEQFRASVEPLPMVLDDLLVQFDDERSSAALSVLADLSDQTQILLFTHHTRLRDLAREAGGQRVFVHELQQAEIGQ
jgi:uncharacterized protein YhaN